jgi:hypothetical protein
MLLAGSAEAKFAVAVVVPDIEPAALCHPARNLHAGFVELQIQPIKRLVEVRAAEGAVDVNNQNERARSEFEVVVNRSRAADLGRSDRNSRRDGFF